MADSGLVVGALTALFGLDTSGLTAGLKQADAAMSQTAEKGDQAAKKTSESWANVGKALGGLAIAKFGIDSVKAYGEAEQSAVRLQDAFARFPRLADSSADSISNIASALATKSRYDDDAITSGATILAQFGLTGKAVEAALPHLVDYAARTGKDIPAAAEALQKAALGSTRPLKELGIQGFKATGDKAKDMATVLGLVGQKTSGFAEKDVHTVEGSLEQLKNRFGEVQEAVGGALVPILNTATPIIGKIADSAQKAATWFGGLPGPLRSTALGIGAIMAASKVGLFTKLNAGLGTFRTNLTSLRGAEAGMSRFGAATRAAGMAAGGLGKGLMGALGGPIGLALIGVTIALGVFQSANEKSKQAVADHQAAIESFSETLDQVTGKLTAASIANLTDQLKGADSGFKAAGSSVGEMAAAVAKGGAAFDSAQNKLLAFNKSAVENVDATSKGSIQIDMWAKQFGMSADAVRTAAIRGGDAQIQMVESLGKVGITGGNANDVLNSYRASVEGVVPGLKELDNAQSTVATSSQETQKAFHDTALAAAEFAKVPAPEKLVAGLEAAAQGSKSAEEVLSGLGVRGKQQSGIIAALGESLVSAGDHAHYFSQAAADTATATDDAATGTEKLGDKTKQAVAPTENMKKALDGVSTAASDADTATQYLQLTLDRLAGRNQAAIDALRLEQAALRGIGKASREEAQAKDEVVEKTNALAEARKKATGKDYDAAEKARDIRKAQNELADSIDNVKDKTVASTVAQEGAARAIEQQVSAVVQSTFKHKGLAASAAAGAEKMTELRKSFIASFAPSDIASGKAEKIADKLGLIPKNVKPAVQVVDKTKQGTDSAKKRLAGIEDRQARVKATDLTGIGVKSSKSSLASVEDRLTRVKAADATGAGVGAAKASLNTVPDRKNTSVTATNDTGPGINSAIISLAAIASRAIMVPIKAALGKASGGEITGGIPGQDSVPLLGMPGEHMLTTSDVSRLGGQAGVYRFRQALAAGRVRKYAAGGAVPAGSTLAGVGAAQVGDRQGNVRSAFADLAQAVADFASAAADARTKAGESKQKYGEAATAQREAAHNVLVVENEQAAKVKAARAKHNAAAINAAVSRQRAANNAARAEKAAADARVRSTKAVSAADARAAQTATHRAAVDADVQKRQTGLRRMLDNLGAAYDRNVAKLGGLTDKLADLRSKAADVTNSIADNVKSIGGGILGSDAFEGASTSAKDIIASLTANRGIAAGFDAKIAKLVSLGLNPQAAEQVATADPTGRGGVVASALAGATKAQVAQINALLASQAAFGARTGSRVAGAQYGAQISATNLQISATNLQLRVEAAEAAAIGNTIAAATRAAMTGQHVVISIGNAQLQGVVSRVVKAEQSKAVRAAAGYR